MDKKSIIKALSQARESAKKRNFAQSVELVVNFKGLDLKKPDHQMDFFMQIKHPYKPKKVCGLIGPELSEAGKDLTKVILADSFEDFKDKKAVKKLAREYDFFVAQANLMPKVAQTFGRYFGPVNKMPNPKAGCVVPPNANLAQVQERLDKTVRILVKTIPMFMIGVGKESAKDEDMAEDILSIYSQIVHHLPAEQQNIKSVYVKLTMGKPVRLE